MTPPTATLPDAPHVLHDRRRRSRLHSPTQGWVMASNRIPLPYMPSEEDGLEVRIENLSRLGVGFISAEPMPIGIQQQIRIGRGPMTRSRAVRVAVCRKIAERTFMVGGEFLAVAQRPIAKAG